MEWISVDDRLPDNYTEVLLFISYDAFWYGEGETTYKTQYGMTIGFRIYDSWHITKLGNHCKPLYWMPMPKPPEKE